MGGGGDAVVHGLADYLVNLVSADLAYVGPSLRYSAISVAIMAQPSEAGSCHGSLRVTPVMEAGIGDHIWRVAELLA
jgi:hypothetical protein